MALRRGFAVSKHFLRCSLQGVGRVQMQTVSIRVRAWRREKAEEIPWRGVAAAGVSAVCLLAVLFPPAVSVLVLLGLLR